MINLFTYNTSSVPSEGCCGLLTGVPGREAMTCSEVDQLGWLSSSPFYSKPWGWIVSDTKASAQRSPGKEIPSAPRVPVPVAPAGFSSI